MAPRCRTLSRRRCQRRPRRQSGNQLLSAAAKPRPRTTPHQPPAAAKPSSAPGTAETKRSAKAPASPAPQPATDSGNGLKVRVTSTPAGQSHSTSAARGSPPQTVLPPGWRWQYVQGYGWAQVPPCEAVSLGANGQLVYTGGMIGNQCDGTVPGATRPPPQPPLKARYFTCQVENRLGKDPYCTFTIWQKIEANLP